MHLCDPYGFIRQERRRRAIRRRLILTTVCIVTLSALVIGCNIALSLAQR